MDRESCVLCACKHIAQARVLMLESMRGYPEHFFFALGHLAEAEDELVKYHPKLAHFVREHRKKLELNERYEFPFTLLILEVASKGEKETEERIQKIESSFKGKSREDLLEWWNEIQS